VGTLYSFRFGGFTPDGRVQYLDKNGRTADWGTIRQSDRVPVGNGAPSTHFGLDNRLTWGRFDLALLLRGASGFHIHNRHRARNVQWYLARYNLLREATTLPYNVMDNSDVLRTQTDFFVEKGNFVKVDNLTLGYALPLKSRLVQSVKVVAAGHNLATFTRFRGLDPEMAGITGVTPGVYERSAYFATRVWALGVHATL
ncbi:MAG: hypothetical protein ICV83_29015, partial [Cytophagales bacterium]|nr:hypothetical protein [Cytophagales bacterium]